MRRKQTKRPSPERWTTPKLVSADNGHDRGGSLWPAVDTPAGVQEVNMLDLPDEMLLNVLCKLPLRDLVKVSAVCSTTRRLCCDDHLIPTLSSTTQSQSREPVTGAVAPPAADGPSARIRRLVQDEMECRKRRLFHLVSSVPWANALTVMLCVLGLLRPLMLIPMTLWCVLWAVLDTLYPGAGYPSSALCRSAVIIAVIKYRAETLWDEVSRLLSEPSCWLLLSVVIVLLGIGYYVRKMVRGRHTRASLLELRNLRNNFAVVWKGLRAWARTRQQASLLLDVRPIDLRVGSQDFAALALLSPHSRSSV